MKKKRVVLIGLLIILVVGLIGCFSLMYLSNNYEEVEQVVSLVEEQETLEKDFTSAGYTIENPNVILNPYQISPLTALVIFETEEEVAPRVTIVGKDEHSTLKVVQFIIYLFMVYMREEKMKLLLNMVMFQNLLQLRQKNYPKILFCLQV